MQKPFLLHLRHIGIDELQKQEEGVWRATANYPMHGTTIVKTTFQIRIFVIGCLTVRMGASSAKR